MKIPIFAEAGEWRRKVALNQLPTDRQELDAWDVVIRGEQNVLAGLRAAAEMTPAASSARYRLEEQIEQLTGLYVEDLEAFTVAMGDLCAAIRTNTARVEAENEV